MRTKDPIRAGKVETLRHSSGPANGMGGARGAFGKHWERQAGLKVSAIRMGLPQPGQAGAELGFCGVAGADGSRRGLPR